MKPIIIAVLLGVLVAPTVTVSEEADCQTTQRLGGVPLLDVLEAVGRRSDTEFAVHNGVSTSVSLGALSVRDLDYAKLLVVLRNNDLAAVRIDGVVNIVPVRTVRQYPLPTLTAPEDGRHDAEWVSWIVDLDNAPATQLVPILRPLLPASGHLAAFPGSNSIVLVDRYANARRVVEMIERFDSNTRGQGG